MKCTAGIENSLKGNREMGLEYLEKRIQKDGKLRAGNILKVDSFLNHQIDVELLTVMAEEFKRQFGADGVTKVLTIEASGIAVAIETARVFGVPMLFAKKSQSKNIDGDVYTSKVMSYTHGKVYDILVAKEFLKPEDRVLIVDDFLANGAALEGLIKLVRDAGAHLCGCGIAIEKGFQPGGAELRRQGVKLVSLAIVDSMDAESGKICFRS